MTSTPVAAQQAQRQATQPSSTPQAAQLSLSAQTGGSFPGPVQSALEAGDTRTALKLCGTPCKRKPSSTISAGQTGSTRDYQCQNGNCACTSIPDCVSMTEVCAPGTTGCNDHGCTCAEKEPDPDP